MISRDLRPIGGLRALFLIRKWLRTRRRYSTPDISLVEAPPVPPPGFAVSRRDAFPGPETVTPCAPCCRSACVISCLVLILIISIAPFQYASWIPFAVSLTQHYLPDERRQGCRLCHRRCVHHSLVFFGSQAFIEL
jgi:hypothetical protein